MNKFSWMMIEGQMTAVDLSTGEIVNSSLSTLPDAYDIAPAVDLALYGDAETKGITSPTSEIKETRGRKTKATINPYASVFANMSYSEDTGCCSLGPKMDDLLYSVATTAEKSTRIPVKQLAFVMKNEELSSKSIMEHLNKRRALKQEKGIGERYARILRNAADILIRRLGEPENHDVIQLDSGMSFCFEADTVAYKHSDGVSNAVVCPVEFTEGDKDTIRRLAIAGLDAQIESHITSVTEQSGRMSQRIKGEVIPFEEVYKAISAEFPYEVVEPEAVKTPESVYLDADDAWLDSVVNKKEKQSDDEPEWWIKPIQVSTYTNEAGEPW